MTTGKRIMVGLLFLSGSLAAQDLVPLPVRKVVLYKNGIGYFEHLGTVKGKQTVEILMPGAQLDDVLKSLTVIDLGRGQIAGVTYDSSAPLDRRLAELPIRWDSAEGLVGLLNGIRGTSIEIRTSAGTITGKLMSAELKTRTTGPNATMQVMQVSVLASTGEIRLVELESAAALKLTEPTLAGELAHYLELLETAHRRDVRRLKIQAVGSGERELYVSYTSEAPIWKTTYRVVLDPKQKPLLQGWAIVDNTTPVDWVDVTLSLVSGAPVSFIQNLSQPLYARRPVVPLPAGLQVSPQLHEATLAIEGGQTMIAGAVRDSNGSPIAGASIAAIDANDSPAGSTTSNASGEYRLIVRPGTYRVSAGMAGFRGEEFDEIEARAGRTTALSFRLESARAAEYGGAVGGVLAGARNEALRMEAAPPPSPASAPTATVGGLAEAIRRRAPPTAQAQAVGEQFEYRMRQPVTIRRNESALLPVVHAELEGEKVSLLSSSSSERHPRLAFWLKNTTGLTLDAGTVAFIDTGAFAGDGLTEAIQPGESRLLSYAIDLATEISTSSGSERQRVERVQIVQGLLRFHSRLLEKRTYVIRNNDDKARTVVLELPTRPGWSLVDTPQPSESTAGNYRFRVEAKPKTTTEFTVREESPQETVYSVSSITPDQIALWVRERSLDPEIEKALAGILAKKSELTELSNKIYILEKEQTEIFRDQERIRGNLQRLGQTSEESALRQRYVKQLEQQESRLTAIRAERDKLDASRVSTQKQLDELIRNLSFNKKL